MPFLLLAAAALFGALFLLNNLLKAIVRAEKVTFWDTLLAFMTTLLFIAAVLANQIGVIPAADGVTTPPDPLIEPLLFAAVGILVLVSLITLLIEVFRPWRLKGSRGLLGLWSGLLIALAGLGIPFAAAYLSLTVPVSTPAPTPDPPAVVIAPTDAPQTTPDPNATPTPDAAGAARFRDLFRAVRTVLAEEIPAADEVAIFTQLDQGVPLARIVEENGGDVRRVIQRISAIMQDGLRASIERGETNPLQGALILSQMDTFVALAVNANLLELGGRFGGPTPTGTRSSLLTLLTETPIPGVDAAVTPTGTLSAAVTATPAVLIVTATPSAAAPSPTPEPTAARTLPPTVTPRPPIGQVLTVTPRFTATPAAETTGIPGTPGTAAPTRAATALPADAASCSATTAFNLRLRAEPSTEADTLLTIPFNTPILLSARTSDSAWWVTTFDGQTGWVDGQFLLLSPACAALPVR